MHIPIQLIPYFVPMWIISTSSAKSDSVFSTLVFDSITQFLDNSSRTAFPEDSINK